nr:alpha/beta fold hydrolase [uncultured Psychromonas sp.]
MKIIYKFLILFTVFASPFTLAEQAVWPETTYYRTVNVEGNDIFYREAGNPDNPTILFLHGYPSSSHMYRHLIPLLSGSFHVVVPDNLGSGYSDKPDPKEHPYTFDLLANVMDGFVKELGIKNYTVYM